MNGIKEFFVLTIGEGKADGVSYAITNIQRMGTSLILTGVLVAILLIATSLWGEKVKSLPYIVKETSTLNKIIFTPLVFMITIKIFPQLNQASTNNLAIFLIQLIYLSVAFWCYNAINKGKLSEDNTAYKIFVKRQDYGIK